MAGSLVVEELRRYLAEGGGDASPATAEEAAARCRQWAARHQENFPVLSALLPPRLRDDFAAVYAFCRGADDLADEASGPEEASSLLDWWRAELDRAFAGSPRHPVFIALAATAARHRLEAQPFHDLLDAFVQDQTLRRYRTWEELIAYCRRSADPVGRIVLRLFGAEESPESLAASDAVCTGLQLANNWQDLRRDLLERDRIYVPAELVAIPEFEARFLASARQGHACDRTFLAESRELVRGLCERTWPLFEQGRALPPRLPAEARPVVELFIEGGERILRKIEAWEFETVLHRPRLSRLERAGMIARAWWRARRAGRVGR
jgi:squalene synthase HpnC